MLKTAPVTPSPSSSTKIFASSNRTHLHQKQYNILIAILLVTTFCSGGVYGEGIVSTVIIKDPGGNDVGPQITLSATVLTDGQNLDYTCIEGTEVDSNRLSRLKSDGTIQEFEKNDNVDGSFNSRGCNYPLDPIFWCTIVSGSITWQRDLGGRYCCAAATDEWYYIHWINPVLHVSPDRTLTNNAYGTEQMFHCSVDMTPTTISYNGIFNVEWQWLGAQTQNIWRKVVLSSTVTSTLLSTGANCTLTIRDFNPIKHGGSYRCHATVARFDTRLVSERFSITAEPKATLKNNKRSDFTFGMYESGVKFACDALSYPFPSSIEFRVHAKVVNAQTKGVSDYEADILSINVDVHKASFVVNNMSEVFTNDTILECRVTGAGGKTAVSQERIILKPYDPPVETTTVLDLEIPEDVQGSSDKGGKGTQPWVIALAIIIPIVIILIIIVLLVWRCRKRSYGDSGGYKLGRTHDSEARPY